MPALRSLVKHEICQWRTSDWPVRCQQHCGYAAHRCKRWQHNTASHQPRCCAANLAQQQRGCSHDLVTLGNLCVDIMQPVQALPGPELEGRRQLLSTLTAAPPPQSSWEVGGAANTIIAALRLGLRTSAVGQLGPDVYGTWMREMLQAEGLATLEPLLPAEQLTPELRHTLLCFVLTCHGDQHAFCSRYDFGPWPLLPGITQTPAAVSELLRDTRAVFMNGFVLDELPPALVVDLVVRARSAGAACLFDPGPRCWTLLEGDRRRALDAILDVSDVVLMTEEEAIAITGAGTPLAAAQLVLDRPRSCTQWVVIKRGAAGAMLLARGSGELYQQPALQVPVADTVGCGDSFAAAVTLGYISGHSIQATLALANAVGAATATKSGAGRNVASAGTVQELLQQQASAAGDQRYAGSHQAAARILQRSLSGAGGPAALAA